MYRPQEPSLVARSKCGQHRTASVATCNSQLLPTNQICELLSYPKKTKNPNPSPIGNRFGFFLFGGRGWITQAAHLKKPRRGFFARRNAKRRALRVALADFSATPWRGLEKSERCPSLASLCSPFCRYATSSPGRGKSLPQAAVGSAAVRIRPRVRETQDSGWQCVSCTFRLSFRQALRSW